MNPIAVLVLVAIAEAVIWLWRLRAGVGNSRWHAALSTVGVCATRVAFLWAGVTATLRGDVWAAVAYCLAAGAATFFVHGYGPKKSQLSDRDISQKESLSVGGDRSE